MKELYKTPKYYEIAFSFRNIEQEVNCIEQLISLYSKIKVKNILEIGCGSSPHVLELISRNYNYIGIDISEEMINYSKNKTAAHSKNVTYLVDDMINFKITNKSDFAYIALGSLYTKNTNELESHFKSVARSLKKGGLYLLDWCVYFEQLENKIEEWEINKDNIKVNTKVKLTYIDKLNQIIDEDIELNVQDGTEMMIIKSKQLRRLIFPQEFLILNEKMKLFDFIGYWNDWDVKQPIIGNEEKINRPIALLRRKG